MTTRPLQLKFDSQVPRDAKRDSLSKLKTKKYTKIDERRFEPAPIFCVDEVGRGCIAGPVFAAAVTPKTEKIPRRRFRDSKLLSPAQRLELMSDIESYFHVGLGVANVQEISQFNILWAAMLAMRRAIEDISRQAKIFPGHILVDGHLKIPDLAIRQSPIIKGDLRSEWIGAASIFAKVRRDEWMVQAGETYPQYLFAKHKGYGTAEHREQLRRHGPCPLHRVGFRGVGSLGAELDDETCEPEQTL